MSGAREAVLARIDAALGPGPPPAPEPVAPPPRDGLPEGQTMVDLFAERVADYRAEVVRCDDVRAAVADALERHGARDMVHAPGVPEAWLAGTARWRTEPLGVAELDAADGVLTAARLGIAEPGTIALDHADDQGRRVLTLLPDLHLCVVRADQVVATVPEAMELLRPSADAGRPITLVSGPSATSDIELERVEGVHGPRRLVVLLVG